MRTKYYFGKPKDDRRIFSDVPSRWENILDCAIFAVVMVGIYVLANMVGGQP